MEASNRRKFLIAWMKTKYKKTGALKNCSGFLVVKRKN
jgi:hypothetical protein